MAEEVKEEVKTPLLDAFMKAGKISVFESGLDRPDHLQDRPFFNLLPIPGLDGGKVFFILLKLISGGRITDDMEYKATIVGITLLIALVILITFNDLNNLFGIFK